MCSKLFSILTAIIIAFSLSNLFNSCYSQEKTFGSIVDHQNSDGSTTKKIILNNGYALPVVAFGTWQLGNDTTVRMAIKNAIISGYRLIDTAYIYGNEEMIGNILQDIFKENLVKREDLLVTTKVWNNHQSKSSVIKSIEESLKKLKLNYLDLVLLHYPTGFKENVGNYPKFANGSIMPRKWGKDAYIESWEAMEEAVKKNLTRSIGVSNFNRNQISKLLKNAKIKPVLNQVECHPNLKQKLLLKHVMENEILLQAYAPIRKADKELLNNPILTKIGQKYNKSSAQVALRWQLERSVPIVVKSSNPKRIESNMAIFDFHLSPDEITEIDTIEEKPRIYDIEGLSYHPDYPFNEE